MERPDIDQIKDWEPLALRHDGVTEGMWDDMKKLIKYIEFLEKETH